MTCPDIRRSGTIILTILYSVAHHGSPSIVSTGLPITTTQQRRNQ